MRKPKVLLMTVYNDHVFDNQEEPGVSYITSVLRDNGYDVWLTAPNEDQINYTKIREFNPQIIGLTMYEKYRDLIIRVCKSLKEAFPDVYICLGGYYPTYYGKELLESYSYIDFAVKGEGEYTFLELVKSLEGDIELRDIDGLIYRDNGQVFVNKERELIQDLNQLPLPARDILIERSQKIATISTSRGCKGNCSFCCTKALWSGWRGISDAKLIVDDFENVVTNCNVKVFNVTDCSFEDPSTDYQRIFDIAKELIARKLNISYWVAFRSEFQRVATTELLDILKESGLIAACIGLESGNEEDLRLYNKRCTVEDNHKIIQLLQNKDIIILPGFINFNPYSTIEGLHKNNQLLRDYELSSKIFHYFKTLAIFKGDPIYEKIKEDELLKETDSLGLASFAFVDKNVGQLCNFVRSYILNTNAQNNLIYSRNIYFAATYLVALKHYKRQFNFEEYQKEYQFVDQTELYTRSILSELNQIFSNWFENLLYVTEKGWDDTKAWDVTNKTIDIQYIIDVDQKLVNARNKLHKNLMRLNFEHRKIFLSM